MTDLEVRKQELSEKYGIDFDKLEQEQLKLAKDIVIKDAIELDTITMFGAVETIFIGKKILSCIIVCDKQYEVVERAYVIDKVRFPYFPGFRSYRELPTMIAAFQKLSEKPDVVFISGQGIIHPRLGLASHFGLASGVPTIGVSGSLIDCESDATDGSDIKKENKKIGKVLIGKEGSKPLYISPGNNLGIETAYKIARNLINFPHKRPEPIHLASKYAKEVSKELVINEQ